MRALLAPFFVILAMSSTGIAQTSEESGGFCPLPPLTDLNGNGIPDYLEPRSAGT